MEKGFLTTKRRGSGKGVKEKHSSVVDIHDTVCCDADSGPITLTVKSMLESLGDTLGNNSDGLNASPTGIALHVSFATLVKGDTGRKVVNFRTLVMPATNGANVVVSKESFLL
ncbi:hypothetical protein Tco_1308583 [Tanacetum coccineum]